MSVAMRQEVERRIIRTFVQDALDAGYRLAVSLDRGWDVDEMLKGSRDIDAIIAEATAGDEAHIFIQPGVGDTIDRSGSVVSYGWVYLVFGNDGWDVICDYSANRITEQLLNRANALAESLS